ncbi:translation initiation factor IF-2 [Desulfonatronovibrio hydrogenovorans]|uniref:translation initiation factor IF-2 n=1 Tax=Desulfonatronovibrio hydrogenovorans TaxID=53245 RepID=UPI00048C3A23|nr:translation initiation factor IF-2 [Desulfonatronovibrio hydrogenovorans]
MSNKTRVRELSQELGISNKELIQLLRELNISVKSHMSSLEDEQVAMVREKHASASLEKVTQKVAKTGVIVRRRKKVVEKKPEPAPEPQEAQKKDAEQVEVKPAAQVEGADPEPVKTAPQEEQTPEADTKVESPDKTPVADESVPEDQPLVLDQEKTPEKKTLRKSGKKPAEAKVRIISKPEPAPEPQESGSALIQEPVMPATPAAAEEDESKDSKKKRKKKKGKKDKRVVDFKEYYQDSQESKKAAISFKKKKSTAVADKTGGKVKLLKEKKDKLEEQAKAQQPVKTSKKKIKIDEAIRVADLAKQMGIKAQDLIKTLLGLGIMATINQSVDLDTAAIIAAEYGYEVEKTGFSEEEFILPKEKDEAKDLKPRSPVVTIMGHVDHGKTSLLDAIRKSKIASGEAGGITQHIGAYYVSTPRGDLVFLDTPGHEAFTAMRARGAQVTDIVILVVAADDGVMDQTREAVNHSKAAQVPIVVAVNKMDKEGANPDRVKRELAELGLVPEEWGGDTIYTEVSAKNKTGIDGLLELVVLQSEVLELKANPDKNAIGHIVEARLDKGRGAIGTLLVQAGTLKQGDPFVCGLYHGKVRAMFNDKGQKISTAGPSTPVEVQGFEGVPEAGDEFVVVKDDKIARKIADTRQTKQREKDLAKESKITLESFLASKADGEVLNLNLVLKADVQGSLEAISEALHKQSTDAVKINIIHAGAGAISESDILLASASSAIIIGFNVRPTARVKDVAEQENVEIRFYDIIYNLVNDIKDAMAGMLAPIIKEQYLGQAEVLQTFSVPKVGTVAGCMISDGKLTRNAKVRLLRDGVVIYTGKLSSLKRFKEDVKEVTKGYECGAGLENYNDLKIGDIIEAFEEVEEKATL